MYTYSHYTLVYYSKHLDKFKINLKLKVLYFKYIFFCTTNCVSGDTNDWDPCYGIKGDQNTNEDHVYLPYYQGEAFFMSSKSHTLSFTLISSIEKVH